jgi:hypothetical protein
MKDKRASSAWWAGLGCLVLGVWLLGAPGCGSDTPPPAKPQVSNPDAAQDAVMPEGCMRALEGAAYPIGHVCSCASDCETGQCLNGKCCGGATCGLQRPNGAACSAKGDCTSGFCADGVCCDSACTAACSVCNLPLALGECSPVAEGSPDPRKLCTKEPVTACGLSGLCDGEGSCAKYLEDTICKPEQCTGPTTYSPPSTCDGNGKCVAEAAETCDPAGCQNNRCVTMCTADTQCAPGKACVNGSCGELPAGRPCAKEDDCLSGFCVDGVCCNTECDEVCMTCAATGKRGTCAPAADGVADAECDVTTPQTCGTTGRCDGAGKCALYGAETICRAAEDGVGDAGQGTPAAHCKDGTCPM